MRLVRYAGELTLHLSRREAVCTVITVVSSEHNIATLGTYLNTRGYCNVK